MAHKLNFRGSILCFLPVLLVLPENDISLSVADDRLVTTGTRVAPFEFIVKVWLEQGGILMSSPEPNEGGRRGSSVSV